MVPFRKNIPGEVIMGRGHWLWWEVLALLTLALFWAGDSALAQEKAEGKVSEAGKAEDKPMFRPPEQGLDLTIWTIVVFGLLLFVLGKWAWRPMMEALQKREQNIRGALEEAQRAREEAQRLTNQLQDKINKAHEQVRDLLEAARRDAEHTTQEMVAKARTEIQSERERLRREIATARDQALQELFNQAASLAAVVSSKAIRRQLSPEDHRRLVDEALAELDQAGKERQRQVAGVQA